MMVGVGEDETHKEKQIKECTFLAVTFKKHFHSTINQREKSLSEGTLQERVNLSSLNDDAISWRQTVSYPNIHVHISYPRLSSVLAWDLTKKLSSTSTGRVEFSCLEVVGGKFYKKFLTNSNY
uniref:Uncharacterized protein n=1 Tax=Setaria digitata TaxID=48799 RepID=A0A915PI93_9BILA